MRNKTILNGLMRNKWVTLNNDVVKRASELVDWTVLNGFDIKVLCGLEPVI